MMKFKNVSLLTSSSVLLNLMKGSKIMPRQRDQLKKDNVFSAIKDNEFKPSRIRKDPSNMKIILFGGEGSEYLGMNECSLDYPNVNNFFKKAATFFGFNLIDKCLNGPVEELKKIKYLMPCIFLSNLAALEKLKLECTDLMKTVVASAGFGIGELNSLVFNDVLSFDDALSYIKISSENLDFLANNSFSGSIQINYSRKTNINLMLKSAKEWCINKGIRDEHAFCEITHYLYPECKIIGGHLEALKFIQFNAEVFGIKKLKFMNYPIAFNSSLIKPMRKILKNHLNNLQFLTPTIKIHSCLGNVYTKKNIIENLSNLNSSPMKIEQTFTNIYKRKKNIEQPITFECSSSKLFSKFLQKTNYQAYKKLKTIYAN